MKNEKIIYFDPEDWEDILKCLENPPSPSEYLIKGMKEFKEKYPDIDYGNLAQLERASGLHPEG